MPPELVAELDAWRAKQGLDRIAAINRLVASGMAEKQAPPPAPASIKPNPQPEPGVLLNHIGKPIPSTTPRWMAEALARKPRP